MVVPTDVTYERRVAPGQSDLRFCGALETGAVSAALDGLRTELSSFSGEVRLDLSAVSGAAPTAFALLRAFERELRGRGLRVAVVPPEGAAGRLYAALPDTAPKKSLRARPGSESQLEHIGRAAAGVGREVMDVLAFTGEVTAAVVRVVRRPSVLAWKSIPRQMDRAGTDGFPIVVAINFLVGTTIALQGAIQLRTFGLDVYVADSVALATVRSLGPLMCAIIVAGRSGAGIAAELGTMRVNEEVDALKTLGMDPMGFLVLPRVIGLVLVVPILTVFADIASILGGLVIGVTALDLTCASYLDRTFDVLSMKHVFSGIFKSGFFGLAIAVVACERGLLTRGGAEGVGRATTSAVVAIIFFLVVLEALFTGLFHVWDI